MGLKSRKIKEMYLTRQKIFLEIFETPPQDRRSPHRRLHLGRLLRERDDNIDILSIVSYHELGGPQQVAVDEGKAQTEMLSYPHPQLWNSGSIAVETRPRSH